jgi:hypothetical protein
MDKKLGTSKEGDRTSENWLVKVREAFFTNGKSERVKTLGDGLWAMFLCAAMEEVSEMNKPELKHSFVITENTGMQFAHRMLPILIQYRQGKDNLLIWRKLRTDYSIPIQFSRLREGALKGINNNIIRYVFDYVPNTKPDFI